MNLHGDFGDGRVTWVKNIFLADIRRETSKTYA
jgi:hypothetical protein